MDETLKCTPKVVCVGRAQPRFNYPMPSPVSRYCIDGTAAFVLDFETGKKRYGTLKDIENSLRSSSKWIWD